MQTGNKFDARDETVKKIVFQDERFKIPKYQRPYSWDKDQVQEFWNDIRNKENYFFLGSLIFNYEYEDSENLIHIIDGQQRILTMIIFLAALRDISINELNDEDFADKIYRQNIYIEGDRDDDDFLRIECGETAKNFFDKYIYNHNKEIEKFKIKNEEEFKIKTKKILADFKNSTNEKIKEIFDNLEDNQKSELAHYISLRKVYLQFLKKALEKDEEGKYKKEDFLHEIIFPMRKDSENTLFENSNLWLLDENLNFAEYISSDNACIENNKDRVDLLFVHKNITFRESNEEAKPITIFEFKRPMRDDFNEKSPLEQIENYVNKLRNNNVKTLKGRPINIGENTPFHAYIIGDFNKKIKEFLFSKDFKQLPQEEKWIKHYTNINLNVEYISWEQLLKDAEQRNNIFFKKLGI